MKLSKKILLIVLSVLILAGGFFVFIKWQKVKQVAKDVTGSKSAGAATDYRTEWEMDQCRTYIYFGVPILLGPAHWDVHTYIGADDIHETWEVTNWVNWFTDNPLNPGDPYYSNFQTLPDESDNCQHTLGSTGNWNFYNTSGMYGAIWESSPGGGNFMTRGTGSMPTHWHVKGTLP